MILRENRSGLCIVNNNPSYCNAFVIVTIIIINNLHNKVVYTILLFLHLLSSLYLIVKNKHAYLSHQRNNCTTNVLLNLINRSRRRGYDPGWDRKEQIVGKKMDTKQRHIMRATEIFIYRTKRN